MSTYAEAIIAMQAFFEAQWDDKTELRWGIDDPREVPKVDTWARVNIDHNDGAQSSMGNPGANRFRHLGIITTQIFQKAGKYGINARDLANDVLEIYQGANDSGIHYYNVRAVPVGNDGFGWYQINVVAEFRYDNIT